MTVLEYRDKFAQLSRYAPNEVANDADKQCLFLKVCTMVFNSS